MQRHDAALCFSSEAASTAFAEGDQTRQEGNEVLLPLIAEIRSQIHQMDGSLRIHHALCRSRLCPNCKNIVRIVQLIVSVQDEACFDVTTNSLEGLVFTLDLLERQAYTSSPNSAWTSDISCV